MGVMTVSSQNFMEIDMPGWWLSGASVDLDFRNGRYFDSSNILAGPSSLLSISRTSIGYAPNSSGTLVQFLSGALRITDLGLLLETARTNVVLWNRDLTNAVWTAANITPLKDQTGPDGVANSASSLLATAGNGTILQTTAIASSVRLQSAWVKRLIGTGVINMTQDNGVTWTAITVTSNWTQVSIPNQTQANPIVGFQIVTSGDQIAVDFVQNENNAGNANVYSSPIPTTTASAARAEDLVGLIGNALTVLQGSAASVYADAKPEGLVTAAINGNILNGSLGELLAWNTNNNTSIKALVSVSITATLGSGTVLAGVKGASSSDATGRSLVANAGTVVGDANPWTSGTGTIQIGSSGGFAYYRRIAIWNSRLADATLQGLTRP